MYAANIDIQYQFSHHTDRIYVYIYTFVLMGEVYDMLHPNSAIISRLQMLQFI